MRSLLMLCLLAVGQHDSPPAVMPGDGDLAAIIRRPIYVAQPACPNGVCAVPLAVAISPSAKPATKPAAIAPLPAMPGVKTPPPFRETPPPFPGPSPGSSRCLQVWDNGVVWERATNTWYWQGPSGEWYHQP